MTQEQQISSTGTGASGRAQLFLSDPGELFNLVVRHLFQSQTDSAAMAQTFWREFCRYLSAGKKDLRSGTLQEQKLGTLAEDIFREFLAWLRQGVVCV